MILIGDQIVVFDTETDGVDVFEARIVTAYIGIIDTRTLEIVEEWSWLLDTGREMTPGAEAVHGISTEMMQISGQDAPKGIFEITQRLDILNRRALPIIIMNAPYDLTLLAAEMHRYWPGAREVKPDLVIDPLVLDKAIEPFRKGSRKLVDLCGVYGVPVSDNAHDAREDCIMAGSVALKIMKNRKVTHDKITGEPFDRTRFMEKSRKSKFAQTKGLKEWWQKQADKNAPLKNPGDDSWQAKADSVTQFGWPMFDLPWIEKED